MIAKNSHLHNENENNSTSVRFLRHDATDKLPKNTGPFDLIVTSPPYVVSYDYSDIFRLSTYFLYYQTDYTTFRQSFIGTTLRKPRNFSQGTDNDLAQAIEKVNDFGIRRGLTQYYGDMKRFFVNSYRSVVQNGCMVLVVGDTELRGAHIPNAFLLTSCALQCGWKLEESSERRVLAKILPTVRDKKTGRFSSRSHIDHAERYGREYVLLFRRGK